MEGIIKNNYSSIDEYFAALRKVGFKVHRYSNKETRQLRGYGIEMNGVKMDASQVGRNFTLKALNDTKNSFANENKEHLINDRRIVRKAGR